MPRVIHFDLMSEQPEKLVEFCAAVFGWKIFKWDGPMEYWLVGTGDKTQAGIDGGIGRGKPVDQVVLTLDAANLDAMLAKAVAAGAKVVQPRGPIPGVGWFGAVRSPDGNLFGLMQDDPAAK
ncbi:VOC family protein [candidate division WOR-3 bacterium]|uniref:VOC family protein n=1 Tax=candidate division WOR-3 bacterium TaxID=2052148 RepID=A0A938BU09_UNCW3|nr:VOC family protein [candidate division WOR-3 bacterium]